VADTLTQEERADALCAIQYLEGYLEGYELAKGAGVERIDALVSALDYVRGRLCHIVAMVEDRDDVKAVARG
jgi:hypothetical protein